MAHTDSAEARAQDIRGLVRQINGSLGDLRIALIPYEGASPQAPSAPAGTPSNVLDGIIDELYTALDNIHDITSLIQKNITAKVMEE